MIWPAWVCPEKTSGTPYTWELVSDHAAFGIRDVTNGNTLPFHVQDGAPTDAVNLNNIDDWTIFHQQEIGG